MMAMKQFLKNIFQFVFFGPLFQKEPLLRWIIAGVISPLKILKKKYKNVIFKYNMSSLYVHKVVKGFWWHSSREIQARNWVENKLKDGDVFLNIGSHIGTFVIFANKMRKLKKTICIESSSNNVAELMINLNINNIDNTDIFHVAAGDRDEFVKFSYESLYAGYYNGRALDLHYQNKQKHPVVGSEFVQMKKIDNIIKENKLPYPNAILMDIDGHELLAIKGMENIFSNSALRWAMIETNRSTDEFVANFMKKLGFSESAEYNLLDESGRFDEEGKEFGGGSAYNKVFVRK